MSANLGLALETRSVAVLGSLTIVLLMPFGDEIFGRSCSVRVRSLKKLDLSGCTDLSKEEALLGSITTGLASRLSLLAVRTTSAEWGYTGSRDCCMLE
jgi:hypothetical protein